MVSSLRFLLTPSSDSPTSCVLYTLDSKRYLFHLPEGVTRSITQRKAAASRIDSIFLHSLEYRNSIGLPGLLMTLSDSGRERVNLFGPQGLAYLVASMRAFCKRDSFDLQLNELPIYPEIDSANPTGNGNGSGSGNGKEKNENQEEMEMEMEIEGNKEDPKDGNQLELNPFFTDGNLKIFCFELSPFNQQTREQDSQEKISNGDSKPNLDSSSSSTTSTPAHSNKRRKLSNSTASTSPSSFDQQLSKLNWTSPTFRPSQLSAKDSKVWIQAVVNDMFTNRNLKSNQNQNQTQNRKNKNKKGEAEEPEIRLDDPDINSLPQNKRKTLTPAWVLNSLPSPSSRISTLASASNSSPLEQTKDEAPVSTSLIYVLQAHSQRGKFSIQKALSAGVQPGPNFSVLTKQSSIKIHRPISSIWGTMSAEERENWSKERNKKERERVKLEKKSAAMKSEKSRKETEEKLQKIQKELDAERLEEVEIRAETVLGPSRPGFVTIHLNVPTLHHLSSLLSSSTQSQFRHLLQQQDFNPNVIIHNVPLEVIRDGRYLTFVRSLDPSSGLFSQSGSKPKSRIRHIFSVPELCPDKFAFPSSALSLLRLNKLDEEIFKLPQYQVEPEVKLQDLKGEFKQAAMDFEDCFVAQNDLMVELNPVNPQERVECEGGKDGQSRGKNKNKNGQEEGGGDGINVRKFESDSPDFEDSVDSKEVQDLASFKGKASLLKGDKRSGDAIAKTAGEKVDLKSREIGHGHGQGQGQDQDKRGKGKKKEKKGNEPVPDDPSQDSSSKMKLQEAREKGWLEYLSMVEEVKQEVEKESQARIESQRSSPEEGSGVIVTPLGTGSAHPSKYRNVSSTLIETPRDGFILLDCGESTYGQLRRKFGSEKTDFILKNLKLIFISHIHADHHLGLVRLLNERFRLRKQISRNQKLYLLSNSFTRGYLRELNRLQEIGLNEDVVRDKLDSDFGEVRDRIRRAETDGSGQELNNGVVFIENEWLDFRLGASAGFPRVERPSNSNERKAPTFPPSHCLPFNRNRALAKEYTQSHYRELLNSLNLEKLSTCLVDHRASHCYGLVLHHKASPSASTSTSTSTPDSSSSDWSVSYSGDTRPCENLKQASRNVTLLIHEATLEDDQPEMADMKGHSTFIGAINVARESNVKYCLLTHFSQRYPKLVRLSDMSSNDDQRSKPVDIEIEDGNRGGQDNQREPIIALAFDLISLPLNEFWKMERYRKAMEKLFQADEEEEEEGDEDAVDEDEVEVGEDPGGEEKDGKSKTGTKSKKGIEVEAGKVQDSIEKIELSKKNKEENQKQKQDSKSINPVNPQRVEKVNSVRVDQAQANSSSACASFQRKNISDFDSKYILVKLISTSSNLPPTFNLNPLSMAEFINDSLTELYGLIGGAFRFDILSFEKTKRCDREAASSWDLTLRVDSNHLEKLVSTLSLYSNMEMQGQEFRLRIENSDCNLFNLKNDSRDWFKTLLEE